MAGDTARDGDQYREFVRGEYTSRFFAKPGGGDPTYEDLANIRCRGATEDSGRNGRTAVNISMFTWFQERGIRLARASRSWVANAARGGDISLWNSRRLDRGLIRTHEKYYLVSGVYGDDTSSWRVHAGSQNWVNQSDQADENGLNIESRAAYAQYLRNWSQVAKWSTRVR